MYLYALIVDGKEVDKRNFNKSFSKRNLFSKNS